MGKPPTGRDSDRTPHKDALTSPVRFGASLDGNPSRTRPVRDASGGESCSRAFAPRARDRRGVEPRPSAGAHWRSRDSNPPAQTSQSRPRRGRDKSYRNPTRAVVRLTPRAHLRAIQQNVSGASLCNRPSGAAHVRWLARVCENVDAITGARPIPRAPTARRMGAGLAERHRRQDQVRQRRLSRRAHGSDSLR